MSKTSLQQQLTKLSIEPAVEPFKTKKRVSLLFDPKEAATLDLETIYQIGITGLEELIERDECFEQFRNTLFHPMRKQFQRTVETTEINQRLDKDIKKFFLLLSPHFLYSCSYNALEWLIYRYRVYTFNKEDMIALILPYHDTNIFTRVLQLLSVKEAADKWQWLRTVQKNAIHLPKQMLFNHAAADPFLLEFICKYVLDLVKEVKTYSNLTVVLNFYCTTYLGALHYSKNISESQLSHMLPVILKGLSSDIPDFVAASYMIVAKLLCKSKLSQVILERFVEKIALASVPTLRGESILTLLSIYNSQSHYTQMSDIAFRILCEKVEFFKLLQELNEDAKDVYPFLKVLLLKAVNSYFGSNTNDGAIKLLDELLENMRINDDFINVILTSILDVYSENPELSKEKEVWLKTFFSTLERRYPSAFDATVSKILKPDNNEFQHLQKPLRKLVQNITAIENSYELFEKLYHKNSVLRIEGLKILEINFEVIKNKDFTLLQNSLTDLLADEDSQVVMETLKIFKSKFSTVFDLDTLSDILTSLLSQYPNNDNAWKKAYVVLKVICSIFKDSNIKVLLALLPYLLPTSPNELKAAKIITTSSFAKSCKIFSKFLNELNEMSDVNTFCNIVFAAVGISENLPDLEELVTTLSQFPKEKRTTLHKQMSILLLSNCLSEQVEPEDSLEVLNIFDSYLEMTPKMAIVKSETTSFDDIAVAKKEKFTLQGFLRGVKTLIKKSKKNKTNLGLFDFSSDSNLCKLYVRLLKMLVHGCCTPKSKSSAFFETLNVFFEHFCSDDLKSIVELLLNISVAENSLITEDLRTNCLKVVKRLLSNEEAHLELFVTFDSVAIPYILIGLHANNRDIRASVIELIDLIVPRVAEKPINYIKLLQKITRFREEMLLDEDQISLNLFAVFSSKQVNEDLIIAKILEKLVDLTQDKNNPTSLKAGVVSLLTHVSSLELFVQVCKLALGILNNYKNCSDQIMTTSESTIICKALLRFDLQMSKYLVLNTPIWNLVEESLQNDYSVLKYQDKATWPSVLILQQINHEFFDSLKVEVQKSLLNLVVEMATTSTNLEVSNAVSRFFKIIDLNSIYLVSFLENMRDVQSSKASASKPRRRAAVIPTIDILDTLEWKKGITVLEYIQNKKKLKNAGTLFSPLFDNLKRCLEFDEQASLEYAKQLILSVILNCCDKIRDDPLPEKAFNIESVVQCIRASPNPQTHHHALLLLAHTATKLPSQVMHNIISIFTFVGSSVLRHDDVYSFQIMSKIIDTIIPILAKEGNKECIGNIVRVFVDSILDVPEHRRMPIFIQLLECLDAQENLDVFLLSIFEAHVFHSHAEKQRFIRDRMLAGADYIPKRLDIAADLVREFPMDVILKTFIKLFKNLAFLPEQKTDDFECSFSFIVDFKRFTEKQFRDFRYTMITFISNFLSSHQLVNKVSQISNEKLLKLKQLFGDILTKNLTYIEEISKIMKKNVNTAQAPYWKIMFHFSCECLDAINALLYSEMFLNVIYLLIDFHINVVRRKALELLNNKLQQNPKFFENCNKSILHEQLITALLNTIGKCEQPDLETEQELIIQKALVSLTLLTKLVAPEDPERFTQILRQLSTLIKNNVKNLNEIVLASMMLCIVELCNTLRERAIPYFHKFMPLLLKSLKAPENLEQPSFLLSSNLRAVHKILNMLVHLSPYIEKLTYEISLLSARWNQLDDQKLSTFVTKLKSIRERLSTTSIFILLPAITNSYEKFISNGQYTAVGPLMSILSGAISNSKDKTNEEDIQLYLNDLSNFFLNALKFRSENEVALNDCNEVEDHIVRAFVLLTFKLSLPTFRSLYTELFVWAVKDDDEKSERVITFYNLSNAFAMSLKGPFVMFAGQFISNACSILDTCNLKKDSKTLYFDDEEKNILLLENVLKTLHTIFTYAAENISRKDRFVNKSRFEMLKLPLANQIDNLLGGVDTLPERATNILIPCIVQFALATNDDSLWKLMNYEILLKCRSKSSTIRLIALNCVAETALKLGEAYVPMLPESVPFLAELMEDSEETIEKTCKKMIQDLEKVLGVSLQEYF